MPQLRPRFLLVALRPEYSEFFEWPEPVDYSVTVGEAIQDLMAANGWPGVQEWVLKANRIAPTVAQLDMLRTFAKIGLVKKGANAED